MKNNWFLHQQSYAGDAATIYERIAANKITREALNMTRMSEKNLTHATKHLNENNILTVKDVKQVW